MFSEKNEIPLDHLMNMQLRHSNVLYRISRKQLVRNIYLVQHFNKRSDSIATFGRLK